MYLPLPNRKFKRSVIALSIIIGQGILCNAQTRTFEIDLDNSIISFKIKHLGVLNVDGRFDDFSGNFTVVDGNISRIECQIRSGSINTDDSSRDKTLINEAYLDTLRFPAIQFQGAKSLARDVNQFAGNLRIKNVEKELYLPYEVERVNDSYLIKLSTELSRKDFNLDFGSMNGLIGNVIKVTIEIRGKPLK